MTDYKGKHNRDLPSDTSLPDELNHFYALFEACMRASAVPDDCMITLSVADVSKTFKQVNIHTELKGRAATFKVRDSNPEAYKKSCYALRRTIKHAKRHYRAKI